MEPLKDLVSSLSLSPTTVIGAIFLLLVFYLVSVSSSSVEMRREPPGPRPLPLLGNLLQLDLQRPYKTLCELSKKHGSVFTVYFGPKKVVVLAGYKAVKEALVSFAEEFGDREISPIFNDTNKGHGILFANGESWREMRRFALTTLRDFGMGKRVAEEKILEECGYLIQIFENHKGKPFDTTSPVNYATSNIISSIVYGSRFEYTDPRFRNLVSRANETIRVTGSAAIQLYNMFPWLARWTKARQLILKNVKNTVKDVNDLIKHLKDTLNPQTCRGLVDCFLIRKQKEEDSFVKDSHFNEENLIFTVTNLFAAGTDTTATTLRWGLLLMAKYPNIQEVSVRGNSGSGKTMFEDIFRSSASVSLLGLVFGLLVLVVLYSNSKSHEGREPPGPRSLPLIGNLLQVDLKKVDQSLLDLSKKYGPVFQIYFGIKKIVVLAGYRTVKQALVNHADEFGNREITPIFYDFNKEHGILFSNGESWKEMRRFALTTLKDFGMGKRIIEDKIIEECHYLIEDFETFEGKPFNNTKTISYAASNVISSLMFGKRFEFKDPIFQAMVERDNETIHLTGSVSIQLYNFFPWLGPFLKNRRDVIRNVEAGKSDIRQIVADLRETLDPQMCRCFVDAFLIRTQNLEGTTVLPLLTSVLYDESEWENPHTFTPSHFLDHEGRFIKRDAFMPFSAGRRACLGEGLARMELFLFFASLLQCFRFTPPPGVSEDELDLAPVVGFTLSPLPQSLCAVKRQ
ncbi:unnamed protein product [Menidia menidia]|uniref:(Atlantic silverside) hypothetical protein n=1 Tax=Menidia menidia TaxID=238744 RepID=A0A8S4B5V1_9TELE|nr:unnamed protein product [Menidia menidia]